MIACFQLGVAELSALRVFEGTSIEAVDRDGFLEIIAAEGRWHFMLISIFFALLFVRAP